MVAVTKREPSRRLVLESEAKLAHQSLCPIVVGQADQYRGAVAQIGESGFRLRLDPVAFALRLQQTCEPGERRRVGNQHRLARQMAKIRNCESGPICAHESRPMSPLHIAHAKQDGIG